MRRLLEFLIRPGAAALLGALLFSVATGALTLHAIVERLPAAAPPQPHSGNGAGPSWTFHNPELDQLIQEVSKEKTNLQSRQQHLLELESRLQAERTEINLVMTNILRLQSSFDQEIVRVREEEVTNLKKLAKMYANMEPAGASLILNELDDDTLVKIFYHMKETQCGPLLENLAKQGDEEAKRAATLSDRLRLTHKPAAGAP